MNRSRTITKAIPLLLGVGLLVSACATAPDYGAAAYPNAYNGYYSSYNGYPYDTTYDSLGFGFGGFDHFDRDRDFDHGHDDRDFAQHAGHHFARFGEHGFAEHGGHGFARFGGHGFAAHGGFGGRRG
jgi:hypothetical protein